MIIGFILNVVYVALAWGIGLLPVWDIPAEILSAFALMWTYLTSFEFITPLGAFYGAISLVLSGTVVEVGIYIFLRLFGALRGARIH